MWCRIMLCRVCVDTIRNCNKHTNFINALINGGFPLAAVALILFWWRQFFNFWLWCRFKSWSYPQLKRWLNINKLMIQVGGFTCYKQTISLSKISNYVNDVLNQFNCKGSVKIKHFLIWTHGTDILFDEKNLM